MKNAILVLITGVCLGWLIGMSASEIISGIVTTLLTLSITLVTLLAGLGDGNNISSKIDLSLIKVLPISLLIIGLAVGSGVGVYFRANDVLGKRQDAKLSVDSVVSKYTRYKIDTLTIAKRIFDIDFPVSQTDKSSEKYEHGVLMGSTTNEPECKELCLRSGEELRTLIQRSTSISIRNLDTIEDLSLLKSEINKICKCNQ